MNVEPTFSFEVKVSEPHKTFAASRATYNPRPVPSEVFTCAFDALKILENR